MIRLDHHTSPLSPNPKQSPEHKIIPWDDAHFPVNMDNIAHEPNDDKKQQPPEPASPPSPVDGNSASTGGPSSSLSPVPPPADEKDPELENNHVEEDDEGSALTIQTLASAPRVEKADDSRQSTPLSELSPAPDQDEDINGDNEDGNGGVEVSEGIAKVESLEAVQKLVDQPPSPSTVPVEPTSRPNPPTSPSASIDTPAPMTPTISTTSPTTNTVAQDPKVVTVLELNVELLKICMFLQSQNIPTSDPRFQQYSTRLQSNLTWLAAAADHGRQGSNIALPTLDAPSSAGNFPAAERIRQIYADLSSIFAKDIARRQQINLAGSSSVSAPPTINSSMSISAAPTSTTSISTPSTPIMGNDSHGSHPLKRERPQEYTSMDSLTNKRRDTGEGKGTTPTSANSSLMPPPSSIPMSSSSSNSNGSQSSPPGTAAVANPANGTMPPPSQTIQSSPSQQQSGQRPQQSEATPQQPQTPQRPSSSVPSTPTAPAQQPQQSPDGGVNLPGIGINTSEAQAAATVRERARQNQIRHAQQQAQMRAAAGTGGHNMAGSPGNMGSMSNMGGMSSMSMVDSGSHVSGRPGPSQQQIQMQQQRLQQMQQQQQQHGGAIGSNMGMSGLDVGGGVGNLPSSGSMGGMSSPGMLNGMGGPSSMSGGGPQGQVRSGMNTTATQPQPVQQAFAILNTPNHPIVRHLMQTIPNFESLPLQQQLQRIYMAKVTLQRQQELQRGENHLQSQHAQMSAMGRGGSMTSPMQNAQMPHMGGSGGMSHPQQLHSNQNTGSTAFQGLGGMNSPLSPPNSHSQAMSQNQQNAMFGLGGAASMQSLGGMLGGASGGGNGGSGMGGGGVGMGAGGMNINGMGNVDPRMMAGNMAGGMAMGGSSSAGNMPSHQRQLMLMQQQRAGGSVSGPMSGGGGPGPGAMGGAVGGGMGTTPFGNMGAMGSGNVSAMMQQQIMQERMRQQQQAQAAQMGVTSPTNVSSPMGSDAGFPGPSSGPSMRSASSIPGIARSTRSPSDSAPSPLAARGPMQRNPSSSMSQEEYQRMIQQQQHNQAVRAMSSQSPAFNQQMMGASQQQQTQLLAQQQMQQQQMQQQQMQQQQGGSNFGMSPSSNASQFGAGISAPSPTNSQSWSTAGMSGYPFAPSPATSDQPRHMSATPAPQQRQTTPQNTPPTDQSISNEFVDLFNWNA